MTFAEIPIAYAIGDEETDDETISPDIIRCYSISITLKWLVLSDFIFSCLFAFGDLFFSVFLFFPIYGYLAARKFSYNFTIYYFITTCLVNIIRLGIFLSFYINSTYDVRKLYILHFILVLICAFLELWASHISLIFGKSIIQLSDDDLIYLRFSIPPYKLILW